MKKIKTHIPGLDRLLHGGIQIDSAASIRHSSADFSNTVIAIRGRKGVHKHIFAMQLMHGLARSLKQKKHKDKAKVIYYSINKTKENLNDTYIDFLITDMHGYMIKESRMNELFPNREDATMLHEDCRKVYDFFFSMPEETNHDYETLAASRREWLKFFDNKIVDFLNEYVLVYNPNTNSLHFRRPIMGDTANNLWISRSHDSIESYQDSLDKEYPSLKNGGGTVATHFRDMFINVEFNPHQHAVSGREDDLDLATDLNNVERVSKAANDSYENILDHMQSLLDKNEEDVEGTAFSAYEKVSPGSGKKEESKGGPLYDVVVIDGFSQLNDKDLESLSFTHLHKVTRKLATITILVLDERSGEKCDGDLIFELKQGEDQRQEYLYHELRIVKSPWGDVAIGWHPYKIQEERFKVFPSIHSLLSKKYYITRGSREVGQGLWEDSYEEYLDALIHLANEKPEINYYVDAFKYEAFSCFKELNHQARFMKMLIRHQAWRALESSGEFDLKNVKTMEFTDILSSMLLDSQSGGAPQDDPCGNDEQVVIRQDYNEYREWPERTKVRELNGILFRDKEVFGWNKRYPATVIVGNPCSFKRRLAMGKAFHWASKNEHVLIVLFGKNDDNIRKQMICPGLHSQILNAETYPLCFIEDCPSYTQRITVDRLSNRIYHTCRKCDKHIHIYPIKMGCITAEEFFFRIEEQIKIYTEEDPNTGIEKHRLHIIIDDMQQIDYGYPFLNDTTLFSAALINLCHEHKVDMTILCDKHATRTKELCTLADNVICIDREKNDINRATIYVEKGLDIPAPGVMLEYDVDDILKFYRCPRLDAACRNKDPKDTEGLEIAYDLLNHCRPIGSMREYWRKSYHTVPKNHSDRGKEDQQESRPDPKTGSNPGRKPDQSCTHDDKEA